MLISARYHRAGGERHQDRGTPFRGWRGAQRVAAGGVSIPAACGCYITLHHAGACIQAKCLLNDCKSMRFPPRLYMYIPFNQIYDSVNDTFVLYDRQIKAGISCLFLQS